MVVLEPSMEGEKSPKHSSKHKKDILLLAQDVNYARNLAANQEKVRNRSLKYLKKYLEQRSCAGPLTEENMMVLWKGLFYAMWMSDKPLVQEECAENISSLIHCLNFNESMLFFKAGLITLQNEWIGIDQLRLNKFLMFVRRLLRQALFTLKRSNFKKHQNEMFSKVLEDTVLNVEKQSPLGLFMHFTEIYLEEVAKVSDGKLQSTRLLDLIRPYISKLAFATDGRVIQWIVKYIFTYLMKQHKLGLEYEDKYRIWKMQGFQGSINQIQKVRISDEEVMDTDSDNEDSQNTSVKPLDPRAGRVDVELPQILFNAKEIAEALSEMKTDRRTTKVTRNQLRVWSEKYMKLYNGVYPLGIKKLFGSEPDKYKRKKGGTKRKHEELNVDIERKKKKTEHVEDKVLQAKKDENQKHTNTQIKSENSSSVSNKSKYLELKKAQMKSDLKKKIEQKKLKQNKTTKRHSIDDSNYCFKRNSGVWFVTAETVKGIGPKKTSSNKNTEFEVTDHKMNNESKIVESLTTSQKTDSEGKNGEYEIFIPSRKFVKKLKKTCSSQEVEQVLNKLRGKSRSSLNNLAVKKTNNKKTPEKKLTKNGSPKKVIINTKLNVSQEIDDHILQVISSPQVPWDSSKKPGKPLLKTPVKPSPINPFYKLKTF